MKLAKEHVDFGLYTNARDAMLTFWQEEVGLPYEELLRAGGGVHQHRLGMNGSVMKINHAREVLPEVPPSGYRELQIAREGLTRREDLVDPDGNRIALVPPGTDGVVGIGLRLGVRDADAFHHFYGETLGLPACGSSAYRCGDSVLSFELDGSAPEPGAGAMLGPGFRYMTIQVFDVDHEHAVLVERGATEARKPVTLGTTARISFVQDPDGNWIEISQRASLVGSLD